MAPVLDGASKEEKPDHGDWDRLIRPLLCKLAIQSTRAYMPYTYSIRCMQYDRKNSKSKAMDGDQNCICDEQQTWACVCVCIHFHTYRQSVEKLSNCSECMDN